MNESSASFMGVYNMRTTLFVNVIATDEMELSNVFQSSIDLFAACDAFSSRSFHCSVGQSCGLRYLLHISRLKLLKQDVPRRSVPVRLLSALPWCSQTACFSPYVDPELFSYDPDSFSIYQRCVAHECLAAVVRSAWRHLCASGCV